MARCLILLVLAAEAFAQSPDAILTKTLIDEIHALRQNLEATTITSQRVQIVLYRLQSQTALVATAQQRLDGAHQRVEEVASRRREIAGRVQSIEDTLSKLVDGPQKKDMEAELRSLRQVAESVAAEESARRAAESDAASQYRTEQDKLGGLQSTLDRLDRALDELSRPKQ